MPISAQSVGFSRGQTFLREGKLIYVHRTRNEHILWSAIVNGRTVDPPYQRATVLEAADWEPRKDGFFRDTLERARVERDKASH
jgi:hypothetical protein